jgi:valyl-tRNA synthetase
MELDKVYNPKESEEKIYERWEKGGYFAPKLDKNRPPFCIIMPPPNANGSLHIGHALFVTLEDIMARYHRMKGEATLWLPGADHAGFETQVVFDKKLEKEGRHRSEVPQDQLLNEMMEFTLQNKQFMEGQLRKLGASCDWSREKFTLDEDIIKIVYQTFEKLKNDGLIYRGSRLVNWCTKHQTSLSDLEIKYEERVDPLYYIKYGPFKLATVRPETKFGDTAIAVNPKDKRYKDYVGKEIEVEMVLGKAPIRVIADEAVDMEFGTGCVKVTPAHDFADFDTWQRHKDEIPGPKVVIDKYGRMNELAGPYKGMKVVEARAKVVQDMIAKGLLDEKEIDHDYKHNVAVCYKCGTVIEPTLMDNQWFVKMTEQPKSGALSLRDLAVQAVKNGEIKFIPDRFEKIFLQWMGNLRDWNISRQIPWGIRIPVWHCEIKKAPIKKMGFHESVVPEVLDGKISTWRIRDHQLQAGDMVAFENSQAGELFGYGEITQVVKTTVGAVDLKDKTHYKTYKNRRELIEAFKRHNPGCEINENISVFAYTYKFKKIDAGDGCCGRTIVASEKPKQCANCGSKVLVEDSNVFDTWFSSGQWPFATLQTTKKGDFEYFYPTTVMETAADILFFWVARMVMLGLYITGKVPFKYVYLHGLVRDKDRQKMSKSKGNVMDPLGVVEMHGADALRMALVFANSPGQDIAFSEEKIIAQRRFANKIWNASRFVLQQIDGSQQNKKIEPTTKADKEILNELVGTIESVTKDIDNFQFHEAAQTLYHFFWHTFCDVYIEASKKQIEEGSPEERENTKSILLSILRESLKLLHPFMPFVTEEIYQMLPNKEKESLIIETWPK